MLTNGQSAQPSHVPAYLQGCQATDLATAIHSKLKDAQQSAQIGSCLISHIVVVCIPFILYGYRGTQAASDVWLYWRCPAVQPSNFPHWVFWVEWVCWRWGSILYLQWHSSLNSVYCLQRLSCTRHGYFSMSVLIPTWLMSFMATWTQKYTEWVYRNRCCPRYYEYYYRWGHSHSSQPLPKTIAGRCSECEASKQWAI